MLIGLLLLLFFVISRAKASGKSWRFCGAFAAFHYLSSVIYFYNQEKIAWDWSSWFIPLAKTPQGAAIVFGSSLIIGLMFWLFFYLTKSKIIMKRTNLCRKDWLHFVFSGTLIFVGALAFTSSQWVMKGMGNMRFDQIVFALTQPLKGSDPGQIQAFILQPFLEAVIWSVPMLSLIYLFSNYLFTKKNHVAIKRWVLPMGVLVLVGGLSLSAKVIGYADIKAYYFENTEIYENYYVDPKEVALTFPEKKRNLVYIFVESMESSYMSTEIGGSQVQNLLPNLTKLAENEGIHFTNNGEVGGGMLQVPGANQTASSMVAQTSGLPLRPSTSFGLSDSSNANSAEYFPRAYSIGEILEQYGYNQTLLLGSNAEFAGRDQYFSQHGNYQIRDYNWAIENGKIPEDYFEWWGYEDQKLFEFAKETLNELSATEQPFNLTMLTADTHFEDGYATEETPDLFGDQYSNVIHASDQQLMEFLTWMKEQPFYENTTVIICGDHLTMDSDFFEDLDPNYQRSVYNVFLNTDKELDSLQKRQFNAMDMFPTTLSALNVKIDGDRLAMGTNLFSKEPTIMEQLGADVLESELMKRSRFYDEQLMMTENITSQTSN